MPEGSLPDCASFGLITARLAEICVRWIGCGIARGSRPATKSGGAGSPKKCAGRSAPTCTTAGFFGVTKFGKRVESHDSLPRGLLMPESRHLRSASIGEIAAAIGGIGAGVTPGRRSPEHRSAPGAAGWNTARENRVAPAPPPGRTGLSLIFNYDHPTGDRRGGRPCLRPGDPAYPDLGATRRSGGTARGGGAGSRAE